MRYIISIMLFMYVASLAAQSLEEPNYLRKDPPTITKDSVTMTLYQYNTAVLDINILKQLVDEHQTLSTVNEEKTLKLNRSVNVMADNMDLMGVKVATAMDLYKQNTDTLTKLKEDINCKRFKKERNILIGVAILQTAYLLLK